MGGSCKGAAACIMSVSGRVSAQMRTAIGARCRRQIWVKKRLMHCSSAVSFDHLVRPDENCVGNRQPDLLGGFEVDHEDEPVDALHRQIAGARTRKNLLNVLGGDAPHLVEIRAVADQASFGDETSPQMVAVSGGRGARLRRFALNSARAVAPYIGYWIGREFGYRHLLRYGASVRLTVSKIKLGQYLYLCHGGKVVFFGRFIAVLRTLAAFLAGVNRMDWNRFLLANAAGGIVWASVVGLGAYSFCRTVLEVTGPLRIVLVVASIVALAAAFWFVRSRRAELEARAEQALPGPLRTV
jgi:hypothetical protein